MKLRKTARTRTGQAALDAMKALEQRYPDLHMLLIVGEPGEQPELASNLRVESTIKWLRMCADYLENNRDRPAGDA
jgi:hypothetical protein